MGKRDLWILTSHWRRFIEKIQSKRIESKDTINNILLFGTPRSGSTWLMEILQSIPSYSSIIEPFHPNWFPIVPSLGVTPRTYKKSDEDWEEGKEYLEDIMRGGKISQRPHFKMRIDDVFKRILSNRLVIKFVRANRIIPWIMNNFSLKNSILLIRHPCAVINSQLRTGFTGYNPCRAWGKRRYPTKKDILKEVKDIDLIESRVIKRINIDTKEEALAVTWCLDNLIPLKSRPKPSIVTTYEDLLTKRHEEVERIMDDLKIDDKADWDRSIMDKPSMKTSRKKEQAVSNIEKQLTRWKRSLDKDQKENIFKILDVFGIDFYSRDSMPNSKKLNGKMC